MTLDELRVERPELGFAVYAYEPLGPVTLEVLLEGHTFTYFGATEAEAIESAFPSSASETGGEADTSPPVLTIFD